MKPTILATALRQWLARHLSRALHEEDGNVVVLATASIMMFMLFVMPLAYNFGVAGTWRRFSQNGSDAAALAGAEQAARALLTPDWRGCDPPETNRLLLERYVATRVAPVAYGSNGFGPAAAFASENQSDLVDYQQFLGPRAVLGGRANNIVHGVIIPPVRVMVKTESTVAGMFANGSAGIDGERVPSYAHAEAYLRKWRYWLTPCPYNKYAVEHHYYFEWKVRLIEDPRS